MKKKLIKMYIKKNKMIKLRRNWKKERKRKLRAEAWRVYKSKSCRIDF